MNDAAALTAIFAEQVPPPCSALVENEIVDADFDRGYVKLRFAEQRAFENHFGNIVSGFAVELIDVLTSVAAYATTRQWYPTVEIHRRFVGPAKIGVRVGEAWVSRPARTSYFLKPTSGVPMVSMRYMRRRSQRVAAHEDVFMPVTRANDA